MTFASIDIGSNTILLLVAKYKNGHLEVLHEQQQTPRLGKGVDATGNLSQSSMQKALKALRTYKEVIESQYPDSRHTIVTATSAVRDAANKDYFIAQVRDVSGFDIRVLSGDEEARLTYSGALGMLQENHDSALVIDIGGGSTEIITGKDRTPTDYFSYQIGSVRFTERYFFGDPPQETEVLRCRNGIRNTLEGHRLDTFHSEDTVAIGVAGTVTSLAYIDLGLKAYNSSILNGHTMQSTRIGRWINQIAQISSAKLKEMYPIVMEGRAEVFLAGLLILDEFMTHYNLSKLKVSTGGIRHGVVLQKAAELGL